MDSTQAIGLRERLAIKKAKALLASSMPLALINFDLITADTHLWDSFPKGGLAPGQSRPDTPVVPQFQ